jgi:hypothetical protein
LLNSGADDTLRVMTAKLMTALPMTLRDDRFAEASSTQWSSIVDCHQVLSCHPLGDLFVNDLLDL